MTAKELGQLTVMIGRNVWETWLVSLYVLLGGQTAADDLTSDDVFWKRKLPEAFGTKNYGEDWDGSVNSLNYKVIAGKVRDLLIEEDEMSLSDNSVGYDFLYGPCSLFGTHANISTVSLYLRPSAAGVGVVQTPEWPVTCIEESSSAYTAHLAKFVFRKFGLPTDQIEAIGTGILNIARLGAPKWPVEPSSPGL